MDVHGGDYTKAAKRAVSDAIRHSSINIIPHVGLNRDDMLIVVKLDAADPSAIDKQAGAAQSPYGSVTVEPETGSLDAPAENGKDLMVIVNVAVLVCFS